MLVLKHAMSYLLRGNCGNPCVVDNFILVNLHYVSDKKENLNTFAAQDDCLNLA